MGEVWSIEQYKAWQKKQGKGGGKKQHHRAHVAAGWRTIGGVRKYYRSRREANYARYLQWMLEQGQIHAWEYEPQKFWFPLKSGNNSYTPDFRVWLSPEQYEWREVKGWMDKPSQTKLRRMKKYHPNEPVVVIMGKDVARIGEQVGGMIEGWEHNQATP